MAGDAFGEQLNYTREELDRMKRRKEIRQRLRREYYSKYANPLVQSYCIDVYDPAHQRFNAAVTFASGELSKYYKTRYTFGFYGFFIGIPAAIAWISHNYYKSDLEKIRTGEKTLKERMDNRLMAGL